MRIVQAKPCFSRTRTLILWVLVISAIGFGLSGCGDGDVSESDTTVGTATQGIAPTPTPSSIIQPLIPGKIRGYTTLNSVRQGQKHNFAISDFNGTDQGRLFNITFIRIGKEEIVQKYDSVIIKRQILPIENAWGDQGWETSYTLKTDKTWSSGVYVARIGTSIDDSKDIYFVVTSANPGQNKIVLQIPTTTMNAYNNWGGKSLYNFNSSSAIAAPKVSFNRPQSTFEDQFKVFVLPFIQWLEKAGYTVDYMTSYDLDSNPGLLNEYNLFIDVGHDEYWSKSMRDNFDSFIDTGGNAAIFSGNTSWWQIRFEDSGRTQVCYKNAFNDPDIDPLLKTVEWPKIGRPPNASIGTGFTYGSENDSLVILPGSYFTAYNTSHWVFNSTGLTDGSEFGKEGTNEAVLAYETDGIDYVMQNGIPIPTGSDGTPTNFIVLGLAILPTSVQKPGTATMGIFTKSSSGGSVFNTSATTWSFGLKACLSGNNYRCNNIAKITDNVLKHLSLTN